MAPSTHTSVSHRPRWSPGAMLAVALVHVLVIAAFSLWQPQTPQPVRIPVQISLHTGTNAPTDRPTPDTSSEQRVQTPPAAPAAAQPQPTPPQTPTAASAPTPAAPTPPTAVLSTPAPAATTVAAPVATTPTAAPPASATPTASPAPAPVATAPNAPSVTSGSATNAPIKINAKLTCLSCPDPDYPALSLKYHQEGQVLLELLIRPDGSVAQVKFLASSGHNRLDLAAYDTVLRRWKFQPGNALQERMATVPINFKLN